MARVLVVDDEKLIVKGIRFSLEQDGMEVDCAYDGNEAIEKAKEREYDVVLLDVMLPGHDGFEVCQAIREISEMPIIMLTARAGTWIRIGPGIWSRRLYHQALQYPGGKSQDQGYHAPELQKEWEKRTPGGSYGGVRRSEAGPGRKTGFHPGKRDQADRQEFDLLELLL